MVGGTDPAVGYSTGYPVGVLVGIVVVTLIAGLTPLLEQMLAPQAQIVIDMRAVDVPEPLQLNKSQYLQLVRSGWAQASTRHHYARSNTRIQLAPGGKTATASATIQETATVQGQTMTSTTDEVSTFSLVDGKLQVTQVQGTVLSIK